MNKLTKKIVMLAVCGLSMGAVNAQTGTYIGDVIVQETTFLNRNDTLNGISVNFTSSTDGYYELSMANLQFAGTDVPTIVLDSVKMTKSGSTYKLSRTGSVLTTIPTLTFPAGVPYVGGMTFTNVAVAAALTGGQIVNSVMTLNMQVKVTIPTPLMPMTVTFLVDFTGTQNTTGIEQLTIDNGQLTIYPNPTNGQLIIAPLSPPKGGKQPTIEIYDVVGQVVFMSQLSKLSPEITIDISHLANGLYFLKVGGKMVKIVKE